VLQLDHIVRTFGATRAVDDVSLAIERGEIVALAGENGAGKTTLMRIAAGELAPDSGTVQSDGAVSLVHQHFMLVPELTIAENVALPRGERFRLASRRTVEREAEATIRETGIALSGVSRRVAGLAVGERSKLELIKAIARRPATLILDEPTSVLTPAESAELFAVMRTLAERGTAVVFISHKLPEVLAVAQRIVVMRRGRVVAERKAAETTAEELAVAMIGGAPGAEQASGLPPEADQRPALHVQDLTLRHGRILAIVGVAGNGQRELAERLRDELEDAGHIPEDRTRDGVIAPMTIAENLALKAPRWRPRDAARHAETMIELFSIAATGPHQPAGDLSGGNQQKVLLARELGPGPSIIVAAEPTRGLDIESTRFVHGQLRDAAARGAALLLITSDLDEAFALGDEIQVIYRGRLSAPMAPAQAQSRVANLMAGVA
jgi:simple sugar transport system ATP-binding protein